MKTKSKNKIENQNTYLSTYSGNGVLHSPSLITTSEPQGGSFGLSLVLQRGDNKVALGHGNFL